MITAAKALFVLILGAVPAPLPLLFPSPRSRVPLPVCRFLSRRPRKQVLCTRALPSPMKLRTRVSPMKLETQGEEVQGKKKSLNAVGLVRCLYNIPVRQELRNVPAGSDEDRGLLMQSTWRHVQQVRLSVDPLASRLLHHEGHGESFVQQPQMRPWIHRHASVQQRSVHVGHQTCQKK